MRPTTRARRAPLPLSRAPGPDPRVRLRRREPPSDEDADVGPPPTTTDHPETTATAALPRAAERNDEEHRAGAAPTQREAREQRDRQRNRELPPDAPYNPLIVPDVLAGGAPYRMADGYTTPEEDYLTPEEYGTRADVGPRNTDLTGGRPWQAGPRAGVRQSTIDAAGGFGVYSARVTAGGSGRPSMRTYGGRQIRRPFRPAVIDLTGDSDDAVARLEREGRRLATAARARDLAASRTEAHMERQQGQRRSRRDAGFATVEELMADESPDNDGLRLFLAAHALAVQTARGRVFRMGDINLDAVDVAIFISDPAGEERASDPPAALDTHPVTAETAVLWDQTSCSICLRDFTDKCDLVTTSCMTEDGGTVIKGHVFHAGCIDQWRQVGKDKEVQCPVCKRFIQAPAEPPHNPAKRVRRA